MMTSEQPSLGPRGPWVTPPSALLLYHPSTSERLRPLAEGGHSPSPSSSTHRVTCRSLEQKGMASGVRAESWVEQAGFGHFLVVAEGHVG